VLLFITVGRSVILFTLTGSTTMDSRKLFCASMGSSTMRSQMLLCALMGSDYHNMGRSMSILFRASMGSKTMGRQCYFVLQSAVASQWLVE
jgi:hypothetical protein